MPQKTVYKTCDVCGGMGRDPITGQGNCIMCGGAGRRMQTEYVGIKSSGSGNSKRNRPKPPKGANYLSDTHNKSEIKELTRSAARLQQASILDRLSGKVRTYITEEGNFIDSSPGWHVPKLQAVPWAEHYQRLERGYAAVWNTIEQSAQSDPVFDDLLEDARTRLKLLEDGLYRIPIHKGAFFASSTYEKKRLLGSKTVNITVRNVKVDEYEKFLRRFILYSFAFSINRPPLRETTEPDAIRFLRGPLKSIKLSRSANLGESLFKAFMLHPQKSAGLVQEIYFPSVEMRSDG